MARASLSDPAKVFRWRVSIAGFLRAGFSEVSGFSRDTDVTEYREGGMNDTVQKSPGLTKYGDLTFRRGLVLDQTNKGTSDFRDWAEQVHQLATLGTQAIFRKDISVTQYNSLNKPGMTISIVEAWVSSYKPGGDFNGTSSDNAIEEMTVVNEGWEVTYPTN